MKTRRVECEKDERKQKKMIYSAFRVPKRTEYTSEIELRLKTHI